MRSRPPADPGTRAAPGRTRAGGDDHDRQVRPAAAPAARRGASPPRARPARHRGPLEERAERKDDTQRAAQRAPAPGHARRVPPRAPPRLPRRSRARGALPRGTPRTVGWAIAACLAARTDLLALRRAHPPVRRGHGPVPARPRRGIPTVLHPDLGVRHTGGHSIAAEPFEQLARNRRDVIERRAGRARARLDDAAQAAHVRHPALVKGPNRESAPSSTRSLNSEARAMPGPRVMATRPLRGER